MRFIHPKQRKEVSSMIYAKPELTFLGSATDVIQATKVPPNIVDNSKVETTPAYDPEEE
jgi:hypothetical protein